MVFFVFAELYFGFEQIGIDVAQAATNLETISQTSDPASGQNGGEEEYDGEENFDDSGLSDLLLAQQALNDTNFEKVTALQPSIVLHPFDQAILELYLDPAKAAQKVASPGQDSGAFDDLMNQLFGFRPSLNQFPQRAQVEGILTTTFTDKQKTQKFIDTIESQIRQEKFVTEANRLILANTILPQARRALDLYTDSNATLPSNNATVKTVVQIIADQLEKSQKNAEEFSPLIVSIAAAIEPLPLDRRTVKMLIYLVTPRGQGGAGHERIKVERIWKDYANPDETSDANKSKETKNADNISRHRFGQAVDISEIDNVKCTLYKKGILRKKKTARPPIPIKVAFQSEDSLGSTAEGKSNLPLGFSMYETFRDLALSNLVDGLSDLDLENLDETSLKDATLNDILSAVGEQMVLKAMGLGGADFKGFDFNAIITSVGQAMIADKLGLPRYAVKGGSIEAIEENVGRAAVEQKIGLPPESLQGANREQILRSIALRRLETTMGLRRGSLNFGDAKALSPEAVKEKIGQGAIEAKLNLKPNSFVGQSRDDIRGKLGSYKFDLIFDNPTFVDGQLGVALGTTERFKQGGSAASYRQQVGDAVITNTFRVFETYEQNGQEKTKQDDVFNTPQGAIKRFLSGDLLILTLMGARELAYRLTFADQERAGLENYLATGAGNIAPLEPQIAATMGFDADEFKRVFETGGAEVFRTIGERQLLRGVRNLPEVQRLENNALAELNQAYPELRQIANDVKFRLDRVNDLKRDVAQLERLIGQTDETIQMKAAIDRALKNPSPTSIRQAAGEISRGWDRLEKNEKVQAKQEAVSLMNNIRANFRAIIDGEYPQSVGAINPRDLASQGQNDGFAISEKDILDLITKKKTPQQVVETVGFRRVEVGLGLPKESLYLFAQESQKSPDEFFVAVGQAKVKELYGNRDVREIAQKYGSRLDSDFGLRAGTTEAFLAGQLTSLPTLDLASGPSQAGPPNLAGASRRYLAIVGRQTLTFSALRRVSGDLKIDGLAFTPEDIYLMVTGSGRDVFARKAGYKLDETLHLFPGSAERILRARNGQERSDAVTEAGGALLGFYLGIGPIDFRGGDPINATGATIIENTLGLREGSVRKAQSIEDVRRENPHFDEIFADQPTIDRLLKLNPETTHKFVDGIISVKQYVALVGKQNLEYQLVNSPKILDAVAGLLGIDGRLADQLKTFAPTVLDITLRNKNQSFRDWSNDDKANLFYALDGVFGLELDRRAGFRSGTFAQIIADPSQAKQLIVKEGIYSLDQQLGLNGNLELAYNFYLVRQTKKEEEKQALLDPGLQSAYQDGYSAGQSDAHGNTEINAPGKRGPNFTPPASGQAAVSYNRGYDQGIADTYQLGDVPQQPQDSRSKQLRAKVVSRAEAEAISRVQQLVYQNTGLSLAETDVRGIAHGDTRVFQYIAFAEMANQVSKLVNGDYMPPEYRLTYEDFKKAFQGGGDVDSQAVAAAGDTAAQKALDDIAAGKVSSDDAAFYQIVKREEAESQKSADLKTQYRKDLQYKMVDAFAYRADQNIPVGFTKAMFEGGGQARTDAMLRYLTNAINNSSSGIYLSQDALVAVKNYFKDKTDENFNRVIQTGVVDSLEALFNKNQTFGFTMQPGTIRALFTYGRTGDLTELKNIYTDWAEARLFAWFDKTLGAPFGTGYQIYSTLQNLQNSYNAYQFAQLGDDAKKIAAAKNGLNQAKAEFVSIIINIVFKKQIGQVEQKLGLVPGTAPILVGQMVAYYFGGAAALNPYVLAAFVLLNLFGFNKIELLCTGDGYYPKIEQPNPDLYLGLGEFNGMNPADYRRGLLAAGQARVQGAIEDILNMPYHFDSEGNWIKSAEGVAEPSEKMKPTQIITRRKEDFEAFFGSKIYSEVFNSDSPGENNRQGILTGPDFNVDSHIHIGF